MNKISIYQVYNNENQNEYLIEYFKQIQSVLSSSYGPYSKLTLISKLNSSHYNLTNLSKFMLKCLYNVNTIKFKSNQIEAEYVKWLFELISQTFQLYVDNNYDFGLQTMHILNQFYIFNLTTEHGVYQSLIDLCFDSLIEHLSIKNCESVSVQKDTLLGNCDEFVCKLLLKLNLNDLSHLRNMFKTIMEPKFVYQLNCNKFESNETFLNTLLKAHLNSFNNVDDVNDNLNVAKQYFSPINYLFYSEDMTLDLNNSILFDGILISIKHLNDINSIENSINQCIECNRGFKCVLFDAQLSADFEQFEGYSYEINSDDKLIQRNVLLFVDKLKKLCDLLIDKHVNVFLCQKVSV